MGIHSCLPCMYDESLVKVMTPNGCLIYPTVSRFWLRFCNHVPMSHIISLIWLIRCSDLLPCRSGPDLLVYTSTGTHMHVKLNTAIMDVLLNTTLPHLVA
jgi:hypothetical protein